MGQRDFRDGGTYIGQKWPHRSSQVTAGIRCRNLGAMLSSGKFRSRQPHSIYSSKFCSTYARQLHLICPPPPTSRCYSAGNRILFEMPYRVPSHPSVREPPTSASHRTVRRLRSRPRLAPVAGPVTCPASVAAHWRRIQRLGLVRDFREDPHQRQVDVVVVAPDLVLLDKPLVGQAVEVLGRSQA